VVVGIGVVVACGVVEGCGVVVSSGVVEGCGVVVGLGVVEAIGVVVGTAGGGPLIFELHLLLASDAELVDTPTVERLGSSILQTLTQMLAVGTCQSTFSPNVFHNSVPRCPVL